MDCNKEEAIRAKAIAEKKMEAKDFVAAKKIAQKAQQLHPELENIAQMIIVCEVHCSAEKVYSNEKDWYGILQLNPTADESSIKKQFRKLALLLHPDKNKFSGSTDAFKLVGEAQRILLDREKRMLHDCKRKAPARSSVPYWAAKQPTQGSNMAQRTWTQATFTPVNTQVPAQRREAGLYEKPATFWTACPYCNMRYQFFKDLVNKLLSCQACKKTFTAYEINSQGGTSATKWPPPQAPVNGVPQGASLNPPLHTGVKGKTTGGNARNSATKRKLDSELGEGSKPHEKQPKERKSHGKAKERRRKQVVEESSESCDSESSDEDDEVNEETEHQNRDFQYYGEQPRRSSRSKRNISYNEKKNDVDDDDDYEDDIVDEVKPSKRAKQEVEDQAQNEVKPPDERKFKQEKQQCTTSSRNGEREAKEEDNEDIPEKIEEETDEEPEIYECPDPDFSDFDKDKKEEVFDAEQMWAIYDTQDAMPRFYARIRKVSPGFKLQITWLEPDPDDEEDQEWVNADLPVSCGKFKRGNFDKAEDHPMFSHLVNWEKGSKKESFKIYPLKGQTWALYKNWETLRKWSSSNPDENSEEKEKFEYEFVEILTNYDENVGISVAYLVKVKGFACLFRRRAELDVGGMESTITIPPKDLYKFSHRVPSFQMTGQERDGVPKGSFELDPAALPQSIEEF